MNKRIKELRKHLRLSQEEFGEKIGKSFSAVSQMERGEIPVSESIKDSIILKFNVMRRWLETGEGEMLLQSDTNSTAPAWAEELMKKLDKLMEIQTNQTGKMLELLGKPLVSNVIPMYREYANVS